MTKHSDPADIDQNACAVLWSAERFCKQYRIDADEEERLRQLFGDFASKAELLMNARRSPVFR